jgi:hypothetical protein
MELRCGNLTQHPATAQQKAAGVWDLPDYLRKEIIQELSFEEIPSKEELAARAAVITGIAARASAIISLDGVIPIGREMMVGGAPYLMGPLETALRQEGFLPVYAFSKRESVDEPQPDGSIKKVSVFRHAGFVEV